MYSYSYNQPQPSMSRLDELLNRNQAIYQNLKQKLDGINRSSQNIYNNINHINTNFSDPFSQESSAIQREPTIRTQSICVEPDQPRMMSNGPALTRIDERQELTFSEDADLNEHIRYRQLIEEEARLQELEIMLEKQRLLQEERQIELQLARNYREEAEKTSKRESYRQTSENKESEISFKAESKRGQSWTRTEKEIKPTLKGNSIYLSQVPKTSIVEAEEEIPTFRESYSKRKETMINPPEETDPPRPIKADRQEEEIVSSHRRELRQQSAQRSNRSQDRSKRLSALKEIQQAMLFQKQAEQQNIHHGYEHSPQILQQTVARSPAPLEGQTPYSELNSHFKLKLQEIQQVPECFLFAPFNKVYRSPILQVKPGCLILQRRSKTSNLVAGSRTKIVDGFKYKFRNVVTDQQALLHSLFGSARESSRVAIVGGRQCLKKKLHMGLVAYCHEFLTNQLQHTQGAVAVRLQHQSITPAEEPFIIDSVIECDPQGRKAALMKLQKSVGDIYETIRKWGTGKGARKILRMTKIIYVIGGATQWSFSIITSNRYDNEFIRHLRVGKICWTINPLIKYYDEVKDTLESMKHFVQCRKTA